MSFILFFIVNLGLIKWTAVKIIKPEEDSGNNRSVMPLDAPGRTRATMIIAVSFLQSSCVAY